MSNLERDLRDLLNDRADTAVTTPGDWQDLTVRMARRNKRSRRVMATGLVAALLVGPLVGFAVARAVEDAEPTGRVTAAGPGDAGAGGSVNTAEARVAMASASGAQILLPGEKLDKLFRRTTSDGVAIRGYISRYNSNNCQGDGWCPPADCFPDATVTGELSTEAAVGYANGAHYGGEAPALRVTGGGAFGTNGEGSPVRFVVAQAGSQAEKVRVSFEGGGNDEMAPVDGVVLLAAPADTEKVGGTIEALDGDGNVVGHADASTAIGNVYLGSGAFSMEPTTRLQIASGVTVGGSEVTPTTTVINGNTETATTTLPPGADTGTAISVAPVTPPNPSSDPAMAHCTPPPPALPQPGEQPGDVAGAKAEVEHAFATAYNGGLGNDDEKRDAVEDSDSLQSAIEAIRNGSFAQQVKDASAVVTDVVFTSPTEAAVRYDINVANYSNFTGRIGKARFIDGRWKVAKVTVCADISLAGGTCPSA